jgi:hypothetical protein
MWEYSIYLGNESDSFHLDFVSTENLFIIASTENAIEKEAFKEIFAKTRDAVTAEHIHDLASFEKLLDREFKKLENDAGFALAASLSVGNVLYLVTRGGGSVFIDRGPIFQKLISGDQTSSGYLEEQDMLVLTNSYFTARVTPPTLQRFIQSNGPQEIIESLTPDLKSSDDTGLIALFGRYHARDAMEETVEESVDDGGFVVGGISEAQVVEEVVREPIYAAPAENMPQEKVAPRFTFNVKGILAGFKPGGSLGKKLTFVVLIILVGVFIWSVVLGNQRRQRNAFIKKVEVASQQIDEQLEEASSLTASNVDRSLELLASSKSTYEELKTEAEKKKLADLDQLKAIGSKLAEAEKSIKKEEETGTEEFYDLNLIEKGASASKFYYDGTTLAMLDDEQSKIYLLNLEKKSVETRKDNKVKSGLYIALHQDEPYIFSNNDGVFRITDKKTEVLIEKDDEWGDIKDMWMYNGNIYMVDAGKDEIYKYLVAEGGYSAKTSYVKSGKADLAKANAMAIDRSIYVLNGSRVMKYESGNSINFAIKIPGGDDLEFDDIFTSDDIDNVYLLDKAAKKIFVVSKDGEFLKQISVSVIGEATDFVVDQKEGILLLTGDKIIKIVE